MQFGKGGLKVSGRDSMLSQSSNYSVSARDSSHGTERERGISLERRSSRTRLEIVDAIKANRQGSGTSLNAISIVNTSSFNVSPTSMGNATNHRRHSLGFGGGGESNDVITVPRRISKVMGFNKLEFNPMALDQDRSGPLLELGKDKEEKKGKDERSQKQQAQEEAHRRGTCILDDNVLGRSGGPLSTGSSLQEDSIKMLDNDDSHDINATLNNHDNNRTSSQSTTSDSMTGGSTQGPVSLAPKHGSNHPMPHIHTVAKIEDHSHSHHHSPATVIALPKPPSYPHPSTIENATSTTSGAGTAHEINSTHPPAVPTPTPISVPTPAHVPAVAVPEVKDHDLILPDELLENFDLPHGPITPTVARVVLSVLKQGGKLSMKSVHKILRIGYKLLHELPNTTHCTLSPQDRLTVVGDIHGQVTIAHRQVFLLHNRLLKYYLYITSPQPLYITSPQPLYTTSPPLCTYSYPTSHKPQTAIHIPHFTYRQLPDLLHILDDSGFPSATNRYLFNGDFVDRGPRGVEVMCLLLTIFAGNLLANSSCVYLSPLALST